MNALSSLAVLAIFSAGSDPVLLQFSSQRCTHCQAMQPVVARLAQQGVSIQMIDVDQQLDVARQFKVSGVPTYVAISGGRETGRIEGVTSYERLAGLWQESGARGQASGAGDRNSTSPGPQPPGPQSLAPSPLSAEQTARAATVRIKVEDATGYGFGTGTIIDTHENEALVVTCGHLFRESKGKGKVTADLFSAGAAQTVDGQLIGYDLDRDIALISLRARFAVRPAVVAPPGYMVRPGDRVFTVGCDKGAEPSVRTTHITAVNRYKGKPNYTAAGQPIDGRSGGGLFTAEGYLIGICNAADPADDEGLYAGLASIHWQLDQIGQSDIYQRAARVAAAAAQPRDASVALVSAQEPQGAIPAPPQLPPQMPGGSFDPSPPGASLRDVSSAQQPAGSNVLAPVAAAGDDSEIIFIVRSKRNPGAQSEVYVVDQAPPDLIARITHAAKTTGEQRAATARASSPTLRTAANQLPATPVVRGQSAEY